MASKMPLKAPFIVQSNDTKQPNYDRGEPYITGRQNMHNMLGAGQILLLLKWGEMCNKELLDNLKFCSFQKRILEKNVDFRL